MMWLCRDHLACDLVCWGSDTEKIDPHPSPSPRTNQSFYAHSNKLTTRQQGESTNEYSKRACTRMPCRAWRLNYANKFAAHRLCFANVCLSECVREKVKCHLIATLFSRIFDLHAHLFGCLSRLCAKLDQNPRNRQIRYLSLRLVL